MSIGIFEKLQYILGITEGYTHAGSCTWPGKSWEWCNLSTLDELEALSASAGMKAKAEL